ncbi:MAG: GTPase ObgE [Candidatus Omnitrophica bacterium]|nr:GTPase ObgE [Candidatus Omnitrophota bacterium]
MFVDEAKIYICSGHGGKGCQSFERDRSGKILRPSGGDGGQGGDIVIRTDDSIQTLIDYRFKRHFRAKKGGQGGSSNKKGKEGLDTVLLVPPGTIVQEVNDCFYKDMPEAGQSLVVAKGGQGGQGNRLNRTVTEGEESQEFDIRLTLKLVAEIGLIGYPNAGKSTLISQISAARPKVADFPFTTTAPVLGMVVFANRRLVVDDLPGLIEGAHQGRGLGDRFLKHIERTRFLVHLVDLSITQPLEPFQRYLNINSELSNYHPDLIKKQQIVVANKIDLPEAEENLLDFTKKVKKETGAPVVAISAKTGHNVKELLQEMVNQYEAERINKKG